jgi:iron complex transport system permease protein
VGSKGIPPEEVLAALTGRPVNSQTASLILGLRLPRTVVGLAAGLALGIAGALIQTLTRNPLADPGILGVNAGAAFAVALAVGVFGVDQPALYALFGLIGALAASLAVSALGVRDPLRLVLAGMALGGVLAGLAGAIRLSDRQTFNAMAAWDLGSLVDAKWTVIGPLIPFIVAGGTIALLIGPALDALALGPDTAAALGVNTLTTRAATIAAISLLAGAATAMVGPIGFVGLMVPHLARRMVGSTTRWVVGLSALLGPTLLLIADVVGRLVATPAEVKVAIVTAFIGAPVLIRLALRPKTVGL